MTSSLSAFFARNLKALAVYRDRRVATLLALGFSSGLPLMLVFGTLSAWLREAGIERATIGFLSWITLAYSIKFLWAPLVDRLPLPLLTRLLGRRRAWLLLAQTALILGLAGMATTDPTQSLKTLVLFALVVAFASATQDVAVDAYRIEAAPQDRQAALAAAYQTGYRLAMLLASAGALAIAAWADPDPSQYRIEAWRTAYLVMASVMSIGLITTLLCREPSSDAPKATAPSNPSNSQLQRFFAWCHEAMVLPFKDFFVRFGKQALLILALIACYRISDVVMGVMANVFYIDMGFSKAEIAAVSKVFGVIMTLIGAAAGGALVFRYGTVRILFLGAALVATTNLLFALQAHIGYHMPMLVVAISADNLSAGIASSAFIAYLSSLVNTNYSATQYALLSSMMLLFPKFVAGFSGVMVDNMGYIAFFTLASAMGLPVLWLIHLLQRQNKTSPAQQGSETEKNSINL